MFDPAFTVLWLALGPVCPYKSERLTMTATILEVQLKANVDKAPVLVFFSLPLLLFLSFLVGRVWISVGGTQSPLLML